ncbi:MAG: DUF4252 domain-containing protein [Bacteroides sp.]|nr:DUF4252 domain-containing protein [Bacteroides sp.]MCM1457179.1 DUF4252 domain-containing protein [Lachnoclostridium sp.]
MKSIASIIVALLAFVLTTGCSAKKQFADIASNDDVTSVYISKAMLKMAGSVGGDLSDDINVKALIKDLDSIEILTCENASKVNKIAPAIEQRIAALKADVLMEANEDNENVIIYGTPDPQNENKISNLIIYTRESGELNLVVLSGTIDMAQVSSMISKERLQ